MAGDYIFTFLGCSLPHHSHLDSDTPIGWRRKWEATPVFLPGKSMDRGEWWATVHGVAKSHDLATK